MRRRSSSWVVSLAMAFPLRPRRGCRPRRGGDHGIEGADRLGLAALGPARPRRRRPGIDVAVDPGLGAFGEALEEQGGGDRTGERRARDVVEVRDLRFEPARIGLPQRQAPHRIADGEARGGELGRESVVLGVEGRQVGTDRDPGRPGQSGEVDEEVRLVLGREREGVGEHQPALGVGVADLDAEALRLRKRRRGGRPARDGVLDRRDDDAQPHRQGGVEDHPGEAEHARRPAHVLLHQRHVVAGLDVEAAGVEADALADQRHLRVRRVAPGDVEKARRPLTAMPTAWTSGKRSARRSSPTIWRKVAPKRRARASAVAASSAGPRSLAGVLTRSRVR